jgi:hypothetical protein
MKPKLSHKDHLLALGILVAVIVMLTTLWYSDASNLETKNYQTPSEAKTGLNSAPSVVLKKIIEKIDFRYLSRKNH